jgi:hypothetical protein
MSRRILVSLFACAAAVAAQSFTSTVVVPASVKGSQNGLTYNPSSAMLSNFGTPCSLAAAGTCKPLSNAKLRCGRSPSIFSFFFLFFFFFFFQ